MNTKTKNRPSRVKRSNTSRYPTPQGKYNFTSGQDRPRYTSSSSRQSVAARPQEETTEQGWFIFMMYVALALGILFIGAVCYVVIFG